MNDWVSTSWQSVAGVALGLVCAYAAVIMATRVSGLRSFAKMSSFDFAMTVAIGTLVASTAISRDPPLLQGLVALVLLYALQYLVARLRIRFEWAKNWIDNTPVLLVEEGRILDDNLRYVRVTHEEVRAAVRARGLSAMSQVRAAVMETTGDISVIAGDDPVDPELLQSVRRRVD